MAIVGSWRGCIRNSHSFREVCKTTSRRKLSILFGALEAEPLRELGTQQIWQIIRTFLGLQRLCDANMHVRTMFDDVFVEHNFSFSYINAGAYIHPLVSKVDNRSSCSSLLLNSLSTSEILLFFHAAFFVEMPAEEGEAERFFHVQDRNANRICCAENIKSLKECYGSREAGNPNNCVQPYLF